MLSAHEGKDREGHHKGDEVRPPDHRDVQLKAAYVARRLVYRSSALVYRSSGLVYRSSGLISALREPNVRQTALRMQRIDKASGNIRGAARTLALWTQGTLWTAPDSACAGRRVRSQEARRAPG